MKPNTAPGNATVLFVEDNLAMLSLARLALESAGHKVLLASDGREALDHYRRNRERIDVVVADLVLPDMSGVELIQEIRAIDSSVLIIVATGLSRTEARAALQAGADRMVIKPYTVACLLGEVDRSTPMAAGMGA
ncbi:MAG: response regulator [Armatimonadota bacterium]|jgi:DNA-binding response OmpR family regulator